MERDSLSTTFGALKPCPDEEGIKTNECGNGDEKDDSLKPCPDEEGIKTPIYQRFAPGPTL